VQMVLGGRTSELFNIVNTRLSMCCSFEWLCHVLSFIRTLTENF